MEKYKIVSRDKDRKLVTVVDSNNRAYVINEGKFFDTFKKITDIVAGAFKKFGNRIVTMINGKPCPSVPNVYDFAANNDRATIVADGEDKSIADALGAKAVTPDKINTVMHEDPTWGVVSLLGEAIAAGCMMTGEKYVDPVLSEDEVEAQNEHCRIFGNPDQLNERYMDARTPAERKDAYDHLLSLPTDTESPYDIANSGAIRTTEGTYTMTSADFDKKLKQFMFPDMAVYDLSSVVDMILDAARSIFSMNLYPGSYNYSSAPLTQDEDGNWVRVRGAKKAEQDAVNVNMVNVLSLAGVGKTQCVKEVVDRLFTKETEVPGKAGSYTVKKIEDDDLKNNELDSFSDLLQQVDVVNRPKLVVVNCNNATRHTMFMPAMGQGVEWETVDNNVIHLSAESVRNASTGSLPFIDTKHLVAPADIDNDVWNSMSIDEKIYEIDKRIGPMIVVFDELFMSDEEFINQLMASIQQRRLTDWVLPTKCLLVATSNRYQDYAKDSKAAKNIERVNTEAQKQRYRPIPYYMTYPEWRSWAMSVDELGVTNVPEEIIMFLDMIGNRWRLFNIFTGQIGGDGKPITAAATNNNQDITAVRAWTNAGRLYRSWYGKLIRSLRGAKDDTERKTILAVALKELVGELRTVITMDDAHAFAKFTTDNIGFSDAFYRSLWTKVYPLHSQIMAETLTGEEKLFSCSNKSIPYVTMIKKIVANCPYNLRKFADLNDPKILKYHNNLRANMLHFFCTSGNSSAVIIDKRFTSFNTSLLDALFRESYDALTDAGVLDSLAGKGLPFDKFCTSSSIENGRSIAEGSLAYNEREQLKLPNIGNIWRIDSSMVKVYENMLKDPNNK